MPGRCRPADILANGYNLDINNPNTKQDFGHLPTQKSADDILQTEGWIAEIMGETMALLQITRRTL